MKMFFFLFPDLICQLLESVQPVFNVTDSTLDICGLFSHATGHLYDAVDCSITQVFHLEVQCSHMGLALHHWKLDTVIRRDKVKQNADVCIMYNTTFIYSLVQMLKAFTGIYL